jgi:hypothetical protein
MKTTIKKMILAVMVITLVSANAIAFEDSLQVNDEKSFNLVLSEVSNQTQITFKDKRNNILYSNTIESGESYAKTFNLELLPEGEYIVEIEDEIRTKQMTLVVSSADIVTSEKGQSVHFKPVISKRDEVVYLNQFSPSQDPLYVAIYDYKNELLHEETIEGKMDIGKMFDFSKSLPGEYRFFLESNGKRYNHLVYMEK